MLAIYPGLAADATMQSRLVAAWVRRKQFEARLIALEVGKLFGGGEKPQPRVSEDELLAMMGITPVTA